MTASAVIAVLAVLSLAVALTVRTGFLYWQAERKGLHLHGDGTLHTHVGGHRAHRHPMTIGATGWRRWAAALVEAEIDQVDAIDIYAPAPDEGGDAFTWWRPR